jgi:ABC-2 type transport system permease protein
MMPGITAVLRKELKELRAEMAGSWSDLLPFVMALATAGIIIPWVLGPVLLMPGGMAGATALIAASFVSTLAPDSFAGERERRTMEVLLASPLSDRAIVLGKIAAIVISGLVMGGLFLVLGYGTLAVVHPEPTRASFSWTVLPTALFLAVASTTLVAAIGVGVSLRASSMRQAQQTLGLGVFALLFFPIVVAQFVPESWVERLESTAMGWPEGVVVMGLFGLMIFLDLLAIRIVLARFRRSRLLFL